ncbi:MAG: hypothetical protein J5806_02265, partial [Lentisphaeria bacterium]|nr:hypothetical protein [Lentisphaeria bacterium]
KSHTFKRIAPNENVFDPPQLPENVQDAPMPEYDFTGETDKVSPVEMDLDIDRILLGDANPMEQEKETPDRIELPDLGDDNNEEKRQGEIDDEDL